MLTATTLDFVSFIALILCAISNGGIRFKPPVFLCYFLVGWAFASTVLLMECEPSTWSTKIKQAQMKLIESHDHLSQEFMELTKCTLEGERNCWEEIKFYVDKKFIVFSQIFVILYPVILGTSIIYVIT